MLSRRNVLTAAVAALAARFSPASAPTAAVASSPCRQPPLVLSRWKTDYVPLISADGQLVGATMAGWAEYPVGADRAGVEAWVRRGMAKLPEPGWERAEWFVDHNPDARRITFRTIDRLVVKAAV